MIADKSKRTAWRDLGPRLLTSVGLIGVGLLAIYAGFLPFVVLVMCATAIMLGELGAMYAPAFQNRKGYTAPLIYGVFVVVGAIGMLSIYRHGGAVAALFAIALVAASDTAGYFAGRAIGGPKFWPRVSPKKTWSGTIAGWIAAAVLGMIFYGALTGMPYSRGTFAIMCVFAALSAQIGDLIESAMKRRAGVKDSSSLLPGHGGFLDRFDGLLGVGVPFFLLHEWL